MESGLWGTARLGSFQSGGRPRDLAGHRLAAPHHTGAVATRTGNRTITSVPGLAYGSLDLSEYITLGMALKRTFQVLGTHIPNGPI